MNPPSLEDLIQAVQSSPRYGIIHTEAVRRVAVQELNKGRSFKDTVKAVRSKLHQVGGAYLERRLPYGQWLAELKTLPADRDDPELKGFCRRVMEWHSSTEERGTILEDFYATVLSSIAPLHSILDVACGLNPLAIPWMPLASDATYTACDIFIDLVDFLKQFLATLNLPGSAQECDIISACPSQPVQAALVLKTLPCLEQQEKGASLRLLEQLNAEYILVSYPTLSLGGREKGMLKTYEAQFEQIRAAKKWAFQRFEFSTELAFLIHKQ